ncbi:hypothetical protein N431DRAFT_444005 [Stipitochalara longipes BDJ]|nr:hypothetical protein N431DRAFT_444005 [Stipitochalara longipes BDJ]
MASNFDLPKELRLIIFHYVFTSPTGLIKIFRPSDRLKSYKVFTREENKCKYELVSLSILRTCKRFYGDCKDLLWKLNTLDLEESFLRQSASIECLGIDARIWNNVRAVRLEIGFTGSSSNITRASWLECSLKDLGSWVNLKSITFVVRESFPGCVKAMNGLLNMRQGSRTNIDGITMNRYLDLLKRAGGEGGYLLHLERKIVFKYEYDHSLDQDWTGPTPGLEMEEMPASDEIFLELAASFGGDIIANGDVYYSNRVQKKRLFYARLDPENHYTQIICLAKESVLHKLGFIYTKSTKRGNDEVRNHLLGLITLRVSKEEREKVLEGIEQWFAKGPKQLVDLTREIMKENPLEIEE